MSDKIEVIEGVLLTRDGVSPALIYAHTMSDALGLGGPGIVYGPLKMPEMENGDVLRFSHAILFCSCGGLEGACGCE